MPILSIQFDEFWCVYTPVITLPQFPVHFPFPVPTLGNHYRLVLTVLKRHVSCNRNQICTLWFIYLFSKMAFEVYSYCFSIYIFLLLSSIVWINTICSWTFGLFSFGGYYEKRCWTFMYSLLWKCFYSSWINT